MSFKHLIFFLSLFLFNQSHFLFAQEQSKSFFYKINSGEEKSTDFSLAQKHNPLTNLKAFLNRDLILGDICPNDAFEKNLEYMRYLFRLLALSYLHESLNDYLNISKDLGLAPSKCAIDWQTVISSCHPSSQDMSLFKERSKDFFKKDKSPSIVKNKVKLSQFPDSITETRLKKETSVNDFLTLDQTKQLNLFNKICSEDKALFTNICSEKDKIFGISHSKNLINILRESHSFRSLNEDGKGEGCLNRFVHFYGHQEYYPKYFPELFEKVESVLKKRKGIHYLEGKLYLSGSLREFDEKNLTDFLYAKVHEKTPLPKVTPQPPIVTPQKVVAVQKIETRPVIIPPINPEPVVQFEKLPTVSAFEEAYQKFVISKNKTSVNMDQFIAEYPLSETLLAKILPTITEYSSQEALKEMKEYDHLGSENTPLSLLFIKILLKTKDYHRLFNITKILGDFLFVINDLDDKTIPTSIEFIFDKNDKKWKIFIVPPKN